MDSAARFLAIAVFLAISIGVAAVVMDRDYRPKKIAETNRGVFSNIAPPAQPTRALEN